MLFGPSYADVCYLWDTEVTIAQAFITSLLLTIGFSSSKVRGWLAGGSPLQNSDQEEVPYKTLTI